MRHLVIVAIGLSLVLCEARLSADDGILPRIAARKANPDSGRVESANGSLEPIPARNSQPPVDGVPQSTSKGLFARPPRGMMPRNPPSAQNAQGVSPRPMPAAQPTIAQTQPAQAQPTQRVTATSPRVASRPTAKPAPRPRTLSEYMAQERP